MLFTIGKEMQNTLCVFCGTYFIIGILIIIQSGTSFGLAWIQTILLLQAAALIKIVFINMLNQRQLWFGWIYISVFLFASFLGWGVSLIATKSTALPSLISSPKWMVSAEVLVSLWLLYWLRKGQILQNTKNRSGKVLLSEIRHHFLFNALNTTVYLVDVHPDRAKANLQNLSQLYRVLLGQNEISTLREEIDISKSYVAVEKVRLGEKLKVKWDVDERMVLDAKVPTLLLQPLIENAVYHGIETLAAEEGYVDIKIKQQKDHSILFSICNPRGTNPQPFGNLCAQENVKNRLALYYGEGNFHFSRKEAARSYCIKIVIPKKEGAHENYNCRR